MIGTAGPRYRRVVFRVATILALTAVLMTAFFSYIFYEIEGEAEFCMQRYTAPWFSFYDSGSGCFIPILDLAAKVGHIFALVVGPLLLALVTMVWVNWFRRNSDRGARRPVSGDSTRPAPADVASQAQFVFWILTASLGFAWGIGMALWSVGLWSVSFDQSISIVFFYAFHLYPAGLLACAAVEAVSWLWRTVLMAVRLSR